MSSALSLPNGRGMSSSERAVSPFTVTSKQPLRGFSSLTTTLAPGKPALTSASSLVALVLNAPQDLQASILTKASPLAAFLGGAAFFAAAGFFAIVFVGGIYITLGTYQCSLPDSSRPVQGGARSRAPARSPTRASYRSVHRNNF